MTCCATTVEKTFILHSFYLFSTLKLTRCANQHIACTSLCSGVAAVLQAEPVQDGGEETDVVTDLCTVSKWQKS